MELDVRSEVPAVFRLPRSDGYALMGCGETLLLSQAGVRVLRTVRLSGFAPCPDYRSRPNGIDPSRLRPWRACALRLPSRVRGGRNSPANTVLDEVVDQSLISSSRC